MKRMPRKRVFGAVLTLALLTGILGPAHASVHAIFIREVFAGAVGAPNAQFVELQMYLGGQTFTNGHQVRVYNAAGVQIAAFTFAGNQSNGVGQPSILIATTDAQAYFGVTADLLMTPIIPVGGGKVCFSGSGDCVSWGTYPAGSTAAPGGTGTPVNATEGILPGASVERTAGSNGVLEMIDDTNNSATDFYNAGPTPRNNGGGTTTTTPATLGFSASLYTVNEADGSATITVTRNTGVGTVDVDYSTADGTATVAGGDYTATSGSFTFASTETSKTFSVSIGADPPELTETVRLKLRNLTTGVYSNVEATLKIIGELSPTPPTAPQNLTATVPATTTGRIDLAWAPPSGDGGAAITNYKVYRSTSSGGPFAVIATLGNAFAYSNIGLAPSTTYYYQVTALNSEGEGPPSNTASATTPALPPGPPRNVNVTAGVGTHTITWDPPLSDNGSPVTSYEIHRGQISRNGNPDLFVSFALAGTVSAPTTSFTYGGCSLVTHTICAYRVRAISAAGTGAFEPVTWRPGSITFMVATKL